MIFHSYVSHYQRVHPIDIVPIHPPPLDAAKCIAVAPLLVAASTSTFAASSVATSAAAPREAELCSGVQASSSWRNGKVGKPWGKTWEKHGKNMGKPRKHLGKLGKMLVKPWEKNAKDGQNGEFPRRNWLRMVKDW